jgi:hypothetical protein
MTLNKTYALEPISFWAASCLVKSTKPPKNIQKIALTEGSLQTDPTNQFMLQISGYAYATSGRRHEAGETIKRFQEIEKTQYAMS